MITLAVAFLMIRIKANNGLWVVMAIIGDVMVAAFAADAFKHFH